MSGKLENWTKRFVGNRTLPLLEGTLPALEEVYREEDPFQRLATVVHRDPACTCRLFSQANGLHHNHFGMPVTTVEHAVLMLGVERVHSLTGSMEHIGTGDRGQEGLRAVYGRSYLAANIALLWARMRADMVPWEVFAATLLLQTGEMAVWAFDADKAEAVADVTHGEGSHSHEMAQRHVLGFSYDELSLMLARRWKLPLLIHDTLESGAGSKPRTRLVSLAHRLARAAERNWYGKATLDCLEEAAELLHRPFPEMVGQIHRVAVNVAREWELYGVRPVAAHLITIPAVKNISVSDSRKEKQAILAATGRPLAKQHCTIRPDPTIVEETIQWFNEIQSGKVPALPAIMKRTVEGIHFGIGLSRVVFAAATPDHRFLKARIVLSTEESAEFRHLRMELEPPHLFTRLMEKPASIWVNDDNRERFGDLLPPSMLEMLDTDTFFARSLFLNGQPLGMIYGDCHHDTRYLNEERYKLFQHLCEYATAATQKALLF